MFWCCVMSKYILVLSKYILVLYGRVSGVQRDRV